MERDHSAVVEWRSFELHPEVPAQGRELPAHMADYRQAAWESVRRLALEAGLEMNMPPRMANTRLALQASEFARDKGVFNALHRNLFAAYFKDGEDIGDMEVLLSIAAGSGLDPEELRPALEKGRYLPRLMEHREQAAQDGITGIPTFIMDNMRVVGAQPYAVLEKVFFREG